MMQEFFQILRTCTYDVEFLSLVAFECDKFEGLRWKKTFPVVP